MSRNWPALLPGLGTAGLLLLCTLVPLGVLLCVPVAAPTHSVLAVWDDPYLRHIVGFSLTQATLSTGLSLLCAIPLARALFYRDFPGRILLLRLFSLSQVLPVIIALFGLVAVHGVQGWLPELWQYMSGQEPHYLFGLSGILVAHVFFNMPLAARWLLESLQMTPENYWLQAQQLGMTSWQRFCWLEWPMLRSRLPSLASLIFMLCFTSFTLVMALGGGPAATTLEVAIYQAIRFDFDLMTASQLASWQFMLGLLVVGCYSLLETRPAQTSPIRPQVLASLRTSGWLDWPVLVLGSGFFLLPLLAIVWYGLSAIGSLASTPSLLWLTTRNSLLVAGGAGVLAVILSITLLWSCRFVAIQQRHPRLARVWAGSGSLILLIPTSVLSTGLFVWLQDRLDLFAHGQVMVLLLNALAVMPYTMRCLQQPFYQILQRYSQLAESLALRGWSRWYWLEWPLLCKPVCQALALGIVFSLGDLAAIALFGSDDFETLPWLLYQQIAHYQMDAAAATALVLLTLCCSVLWLVETGLPWCSQRLFSSQSSDPSC
jgi:thiamine transport system permease protein